jgi:hypothetical protein
MVVKLETQEGGGTDRQIPSLSFQSFTREIISSSIEFLKQVEASLFNRHTFVYIY